MKWTNEFLDQKRLLADPVADELVRLLMEENGPGEARRLFEELITNIDMPLGKFPPIIQDYLTATNQLPDWVEEEKVQMAHELFLDHGPKFLFFYYYKSLPLLYSCANGAQVLVKTARLTRKDQNIEIFTRRIAETGQFLMDVMTRNGLKPGGRGIQSIQKVRLIHSSIRQFLPRDDWEEDILGKPINQEDMAVTLMTFSISVIDALGQFNISETEERKEAYFHTWMGIGHLLGVSDDLLPSTLEEARDLINTILDRQATASESGQLLGSALVQFAMDVIPTQYFDDSPVFIIRHLIGREKADMLDLQTRYGCLGVGVPILLQKVFQLGEKLEDKAKQPLSVLIEKLSETTARAMVGYFDKYKNRNFDIPQEMQKEWFGK